MKIKFCYTLQRAGHSQNECLWAWLQPGVYFGSVPPPPSGITLDFSMWPLNSESQIQDKRIKKLSQERAF
jgi:hypothetical protein